MFVRSYGQTDSIRVWNKWCRKPDSFRLFMGAYNLVQVYGPGINASDITFKSKDKNLKISKVVDVKSDTVSVMVMPYTVKKKLPLSIVSKKTGEVLKTIDFSAETVPEPVAKIGKFTGGPVSKIDLMSYINISVQFPNCLYNYPYKIIEYKFKTHYDNKDIVVPVAGNFIPKEILGYIRDAPVGTKVTFTGIKATCPDCSPHPVADLTFTLE
jgi:GldM C-terminal domain